MKLIRIQSLSELRHCAPAWDDLWYRSESTLPTHRAELIAQWVEHFAPHAPYLALAVEDAGQMVAAISLYGTRKGGFRVGTLTANSWSDSGALLLDRTADSARAASLLVQGVRQTGWPLFMFDGVNLNDSPWRAWVDEQQSSSVTATSKPKFRIGLIDITHDWDAYKKAWSSNHRRAIKKLREAADQDGPAELVALTELSSDAVEPHLHQAFEIEDKSWKGQAGSSILRTPRAYDFFLRQAQQLAAWRQLELYFLEFRGQPIAFDFCYSAKGVLSSHKIGYDDDFRKYGPFQLLRSHQLEGLFADPARRLLDTLGIMGEANAKWSTRYVENSRMLMAGTSLMGSTALCGYQHVWPLVRRLMRRAEENVPMLEPGSARLLQKSGQEGGNTVAVPQPVVAG